MPSVTRTALPADTWKSEDFCHGGKRQHARTAAGMVRMLLLMAGIAAVLADPTTPPVAEQQQPAAAEAPVATEEDVVATATFTMTNNGESSEKLCTMRRGQDAAAAAVSFAEVHQVNAEGLLQIAQHMAGLTIAGYEPPKVSE